MHLAGGHDPDEAERSGKKGKITAFSLDSWYFPVLACADDLEILAASKEALEQTKEDPTTSFKEMGLDIGHSKTNWSSAQKQEITRSRAGTEMEQCKEKFAFVKRTYTTRKRILDLPMAFFVEKNGSIEEISMAESVVASCCAAPDKRHGSKN